MTEHEKSVLAESLDQLDAVITMARANFLRDSSICIRTNGANPNASCTISSRTLQILTEAGRKALEESR